MKNLVLSMSLALALSAHAQPLVTNLSYSAQYQGTLAIGTAPPQSFNRYREATGAGGFSSSTSFGAAPQIAAGFNDEIFATFNGPVDYLRVRGNATSIVQVGATATLQQATASSFGRLEFDIATEIRFDVTGGLVTSGVFTSGPGAAIGISSIRLLRNNALYAINLYRSSLDNGTVPLNISGTLLPGHYLLETYITTAATASEAGSHWAATSTYDARFDFSPIPAPATFALFPLALFARRRR